MTDQHPITPPPELVQQWYSEAVAAEIPGQLYLATQAARWGADQELEACCEWLDDTDCDDPQEVAQHLHLSRRPEPTLKEQARDALGRFFSNARTSASQMTEDFDLLRRAVETLPE